MIDDYWDRWFAWRKREALERAELRRGCLSVADYARRVGVSRQQVLIWISSGRLFARRERWGLARTLYWIPEETPAPAPGPGRTRQPDRSVRAPRPDQSVYPQDLQDLQVINERSQWIEDARAGVIVDGAGPLSVNEGDI
ncbi:MAG: hypothetical protein NUV51_03715 [Sulfuricaulis sp.]|nr:hypothetical protein [Sulfuricaulis sp.]